MEGQELVILHDCQGWNHSTLGSQLATLILIAAAQCKSLMTPEFMMDDTVFRVQKSHPRLLWVQEGPERRDGHQGQE